MCVYVCVLIKKRRYWPKYIEGGDINARLKDEDVGHTSRLPGIIDSIKFEFFCYA